MSTTAQIEHAERAGARAERIDPISDERWLPFVERSPSGSVFHHPAWLRLLHDQYGYDLRACCVTDGDGEIVAGVPLAEIRSRVTGRRLVGLPFSDVCPPLFADGSQAAGDELALALERQRQEAGALPLELHGEFPQYAPGHAVSRFVQHVLELGPDVEAVERGYSKSQVRAAIRKARRAGVTVERHTGGDALSDFYRLHAATRARQGVPTQPKRFITRFEGLFDAGLGFVMLARVDGHVAAAAVFLTFNGTVTYKYGASDARFLKQRPNNLLFSEAITWGCEGGYERLDFGRSDLDNEGLRRFKCNWGAAERPLAYTYAPSAPASFDDGLAARLMKRTLQRGPAGASRLVGEVLYKHYG